MPSKCASSAFFRGARGVGTDAALPKTMAKQIGPSQILFNTKTNILVEIKSLEWTDGGRTFVAKITQEIVGSRREQILGAARADGVPV